ncbi:protein translocase subunit SecD [Cellulomonas carbonis]|uniref:Multifunctional fusion protein n=1 Tax=Cellulomonas carbonis T26 TaxID=947969 RepID=A0A0A0BTN7_9CELL|nr:protein translocase subunit SecD [Cellulomonas carbonis]KGM11310.1 preprotein translocase subunit SecD [Cellulomonas carbonis T26]GGC00835.1 protein translocase subunit SecDF [Cellulomonas carbonis]
MSTPASTTASRRPLLVRAILSLAVLAGAVAAVVTQSPTLGLDLRGGTQIVLETQSTSTIEADAESTDRALEVLRRRIDALGVAEPTVVRSGERRIVVELPGLQDPAEAVAVIGRTAQLSFHAVTAVGPPEAPTDEGEGEGEAGGEEAGEEPQPTDEEITVTDESGATLTLAPAALTGEAVSGADAVLDTQSGLGWHVTLDFRSEGQSAWRELTAEAACQPFGEPGRRVAVVLDGEAVTSPEMGSDIACGAGITGSTTRITGNFTQEEALELAAVIEGGALPLPVEVIEQRTVGPSLGAAAIDASVRSILLGVAITAVFIVVAYRLMGLLAIVALACYALITYAALLGLGATITLPGLAGFVLSVGMAVDANVLVYERAREERAVRGRSLRTSVIEGFRKALPAIADSNVTTLISAGLLFFLASGPVRGFGVTLTIGVLASFFSALVITRVLAEAVASMRAVEDRPRITGIAHLGRLRDRLSAMDPGFMDRPLKWLAVSFAVLVVTGAGVVARGLELGVEFTGGRSIQYETAERVDADTAREAVVAAGFPSAVVQEAGEGDVSVRVVPIDDAEQERIRSAIAEVAGDATVVSDELIGPSLGDELRRNALIALGVALAAQLAYLAIRFHWTFSSGAVAALATNVVVVLGVFAWLGKPLDGVFLAALLTIIGYSVNDSVVVFDRVRETWRARREEPFGRLAATAILQTIPRTVNTGASTLFVLVALLIFGGDSLGDFALALVLGIVVGTLSTVTVAVPLTAWLQQRFPSRPKPDEVEPFAGRNAERRDDGAVV